MALTKKQNARRYYLHYRLHLYLRGMGLQNPRFRLDSRHRTIFVEAGHTIPPYPNRWVKKLTDEFQYNLQTEIPNG